MSDWHRWEVPVTAAAFIVGMVLIIAGVIADVQEIVRVGWFIMPVSVGFAMGRISRG